MSAGLREKFPLANTLFAHSSLFQWWFISFFSPSVCIRNHLFGSCETEAIKVDSDGQHFD